MRLKILNLALAIILMFTASAAVSAAEPEIDSLLNILKHNHAEPERMKIYSELSMLMNRRNADSGLSFAKKALALNAKYNNKGVEADIHYGTALNYIVKSDYSKSLANLFKALAIYEKLNDTEAAANTLNLVGVAFASSGDFPKGIQYVSQSLDISTKLGLKPLMVKALSNLGEMNLVLMRVNQAKEYFDRALEINKSLGDLGVTMNLYTGIGNAYAQVKQFDKAIHYYKLAIELAKSLHRRINEAYISTLIASIHFHSVTDSSATAGNTISANTKRRKISLAIDYLNYSKEIFLKHQSVNEIKDVYKQLYTMHKALGRSDSALHYFEMATVMIDSANAIETTRKMEQMESERNLSIKDAQLKKAESDATATHRLVYIIAIIAVGIALALIWASIILKNKKKLLNILEEKNAVISAANTELDTLSKHLQETNATKDKFFSIIAHDLKSPFSGIINLTKFMSENIDEFSKEELIESSKTLNHSAVKLYKLLENLLEWSRLQRGITEFKPCSLSVYELVEDCLSVLQSVASQKSITIYNYIAADTYITADYRMVETLFRNLISNAIKFTNRSGQIDIRYTANDSHHIFAVQDSGIGIAPEIIDKLFKIDQRVSNLGTEGESSTGLGLLLCKEFTDRHNGQIWIDSKINSGSTFYFSIAKELD